MPDLALQPSIAQDLRSRALLSLIARLGPPGALPRGILGPGRIDVSPLLVYWITQPAWAPDTAYPLGAVTVDPNHNLQRVTVAGTSGPMAPTWNPAIGGLTAEAAPSTVVWANGGPQAATPPESALPYLLWQFDVLSPFWSLLAPAGTSDTPARRRLIKMAIALHRRRGTWGCVLDALAALGWPGSRILEGEHSWGGHRWPLTEQWAVCRILLSRVVPSGGTSEIPIWDPNVSYSPGDLVLFPDQFGVVFVASLATEIGVPPYWTTVDQITDIGVVADIGAMIPGVSGPVISTIFWAIPSEIPTLAEAELIAAAFEFFAPRRCWLDNIFVNIPPIVDRFDLGDSSGAGPTDRFRLTEKIVFQFPAITDRFKLTD